MRLTTCFSHCCTRYLSRCQSRRPSILPKWRRRGPLELPFGSGNWFTVGIRSGFASGSLGTASGDGISTILRSAAMSFCILWRSRSLACSSCSVACSKFCRFCCSSCCSSYKPSCSYCRSGFYYSGKETVSLFGVYSLLLGKSMQFVVKNFVFGPYCSLQFVFGCILNVGPKVFPCVGYRKMWPI